MTTAARRVCVTGATGKAGRAAVQELREHGYDVVATDAVVGAGEPRGAVLRADLTDYGEATEVLRGADAVVHLANIPAPGMATPAVTFNANIAMNFNVFHAAAALGLSRVVWASSETTLGLPFGGGPEQIPGVAGPPPRYAPVDEEHYPFPTTTYALSKVASETIAAQITQWSGIPFVGLRISNIMDPDEYQRFPSFWPDPQLRKWNVWGYVDVRDVAAACRLGLEAEVTGSQNVIIAAANTVMNRPSRDDLAEVFPGVPVIRDVAEFGTLLAIDRARDLLGYEPAHSWRDYEDRLVGAGRLFRGGPGGGELADVRARGECPRPGAAQHQDADAGQFRRLGQQSGQPREHGERDGVQPLWPADRDDGGRPVAIEEQRRALVPGLDRGRGSRRRQPSWRRMIGCSICTIISRART